MEVLSVPTVHMNGTGKEDLVLQMENVYQTINATIDAMCLSRPHGRDYYTQGDNALQVAQKQWEVRMDSLLKIKEDVTGIVTKIYDQG